MSTAREGLGPEGLLGKPASRLLSVPDEVCLEKEFYHSGIFERMSHKGLGAGRQS